MIVSSIYRDFKCSRPRSTAVRGDFRASEKLGVLINGQPRRFDIAMQGCARFEHTTFRRKHIALDPALDDHGLCSDLTANVRVFADYERASGVDFSLHVAVNQQLVAESQIAVDRYSAGKDAA